MVPEREDPRADLPWSDPLMAEGQADRCSFQVTQQEGGRWGLDTAWPGARSKVTVPLCFRPLAISLICHLGDLHCPNGQDQAFLLGRRCCWGLGLCLWHTKQPKLTSGSPPLSLHTSTNDYAHPYSQCQAQSVHFSPAPIIMPTPAASAKHRASTPHQHQ